MFTKFTHRSVSKSLTHTDTDQSGRIAGYNGHRRLNEGPPMALVFDAGTAPATEGFDDPLDEGPAIPTGIGDLDLGGTGCRGDVFARGP